jgi:catechol 2,3-dioxygenase-like lactoylglutathione lyase family enzyme
MTWSIHHVSLVAHDLDAAAHFFGTLIGPGVAWAPDGQSRFINEAGIEPSVGSVGDSCDNAPQRASAGSTKPPSFTALGRGAASKRWNSPPWDG